MKLRSGGTELIWELGAGCGPPNEPYPIKSGSRSRRDEACSCRQRIEVKNGAEARTVVGIIP